MALACWASVFTATKRIVGREAASAIASASAASFFCRFTKGWKSHFDQPAGLLCRDPHNVTIDKRVVSSKLPLAVSNKPPQQKSQ